MLVRLEDDEFQGQYQQAQGAVEKRRAYISGDEEWLPARRNPTGAA